MKRFFAFFLTSLFFAAAAHASISGTVVDDDGAPISGASVRSFAPATSREIVARVLGGKIERDPIAKIETAADGAFRIESGSSPLVTLVVTAPGRQYVELDALDGEDLGPIMISLQKTRTIRVTANGKPVASASVRAATAVDGLADRQQRRVATVQTQPDGRFQIDLFAGCEYSLTAENGAPGKATARGAVRRFAIEPEDKKDLGDVRLGDRVSDKVVP